MAKVLGHSRRGGTLRWPGLGHSFPWWRLPRGTAGGVLLPLCAPRSRTPTSETPVSLSLALWLEASAPYGSVYAQFIPASLPGVPGALTSEAEPHEGVQVAGEKAVSGIQPSPLQLYRVLPEDTFKD